MITHTDFFNRAMEDNEYGAVMTVEDLVEKDLEASYNAYNKAVDNWEEAHQNREKGNISNYEYDVVFIEMQKKYVEYLEKNLLYDLFKENLKRSKNG